MKEAKCAKLKNGGGGEEPEPKGAERYRFTKVVMVDAKAGGCGVVMEESRLGLGSYSGRPQV